MLFGIMGEAVAVKEVAQPVVAMLKAIYYFLKK